MGNPSYSYAHTHPIKVFIRHHRLGRLGYIILFSLKYILRTLRNLGFSVKNVFSVYQLFFLLNSKIVVENHINSVTHHNANGTSVTVTHKLTVMNCQDASNADTIISPRTVPIFRILLRSVRNILSHILRIIIKVVLH